MLSNHLLAGVLLLCAPPHARRRGRHLPPGPSSKRFFVFDDGFCVTWRRLLRLALLQLSKASAAGFPNFQERKENTNSKKARNRTRITACYYPHRADTVPLFRTRMTTHCFAPPRSAAAPSTPCCGWRCPARWRRRRSPAPSAPSFSPFLY